MTPTATKPHPIFPQFAGTRRFTPDEYHRLIDAGILGPDDRVELLDGYITYMADRAQLPTDTMFPEWHLLRRWSPAEYQRMIQLGIIGADERLERLDGYLVLKMPMSNAHRGALLRLAANLPARLPKGWLLMSQCPVSLGMFDPQPDGAVVRGGITDYDTRDVVATDFGIAIEVSDSTLDLDRVGKGRGYARAGIAVYWIINVEDKQIEVYGDPDSTANPPEYRTRTDYKPGDTVPITLDGRAVGAIAVSELLP